MSWSLSASGHSPDQDAERSFLDRLRAALTHEHAGASSATVYTQHHGQVNLLTEDQTTADESARPTAPTATVTPLATAGIEASGQPGEAAPTATPEP